ncbi:MAG: glycosyltransferase family 39 protein [Candidatus Micrarchaeaceae archaeon]
MILGYAFTSVFAVSFIGLIVSLFLARREIRKSIAGVSRGAMIALIATLVFFLVFALVLVKPVEQLYFDENIYQGIALNILMHGNALWCQYGTGYLHSCFENAIYHDPVEISFFIAMAFAIFGIGTTTAYNMQLLIGAISIVAVFGLAYAMFKRNDIAVASTFAFALTPMLFIWSRTQADPDPYFMLLSTIAFFLFVVFAEHTNRKTLTAFMFSLVLAAYARSEGALLIALFAILMLAFGKGGIKKTISMRLPKINYAINSDTKTLVVFLAFIVMMIPQVYYLASELQSPQYGQPSNQSIISLSNFAANLMPNVDFFSGAYNNIYSYPIVFPWETTLLALIGAAFLAFYTREKNRFSAMLLLGLWILAYFAFYTAFYAGAATYGVDSRFMLQLLPGIAILAGVGIAELSDASGKLIYMLRIRRRPSAKTVVVYFPSRYAKYRYAVFAAVVVAAIFVPFALLMPITTIAPESMPQQGVILPAMNFFYANYSKVPANCLVFSFTPDIWYEVNRSSAQIGYLGSLNANFTDTLSKYNCFVFDYGYWCLVPPYHSTACKYTLEEYKTKLIVQGSETSTGNAPALYMLLNYTS